MGKKIKPFREWKKERKRILRAKGIDVSEISERRWKSIYGAAKFHKGRKQPLESNKKRSKTLLKFYKTPEGKKVAKKLTKSRKKFYSTPEGKKLRKLTDKKIGKALKGRDCYWLKGKTYEEIYGKKEAERIKKQIGKGNKGKKRTKKMREKSRLANLGKKRSPESIEKTRKARLGKPCPWAKGKNHPLWNGGSSFQGYPSKFYSKSFKELIRNRFGRKCMICFHTERHKNGYGKKLFLHHINYKKNDCNLNNLIPMHMSCHSSYTIHGNKKYWKSYFRNIMKTLTK